MKQLKVKVMAMVLIAILVTLIVPLNVFAVEGETENENLQIVKTVEGKYIIYVKELAKTEFKYKIGDEIDATYINSVPDEEENQVVLITAENAENAEGKNLYIKTDKEEKTTKLNLADAFDQAKLEEVETTTKRIKTESIQKEIPTTAQTEDGTTKTIKTTIGGLKITAEGNKYQYAITKLPAKKEAEEYAKLMELARTLENTKKYDSFSKYEKIETEKTFYELYNSLKEKQEWKNVENKEVWQPEDSLKGDQYIVFLKEVDQNGNEKIADAKFMIADREDLDGVDTTAEVVETKRTTKLPITGDSIILFAILAVILLVAIIVFIRMKKLQGKENK